MRRARTASGPPRFCEPGLNVPLPPATTNPVLLPLARTRAMTTTTGTPGSALRLDFPQDGIARVTFDQPGSRANTLNQGVLGELEQVLGQLESRSDLRGVVFCSGKSGIFIAGADLRE